MKNGNILRGIRSHFDELKKVWMEEKRQYGPGALVFHADFEPGSTADEINCEFWTMAELRAELRAQNEPDERLYKWLRDVDVTDGFAIVILSAEQTTGTNGMQFQRLVRESSK